MDETDNNPDIIIPPDDSSDTSSSLLETISRDTSSIKKLLSETEGENLKTEKLMRKQRKEDKAKETKKEKLEKKDREERSRFYKAISYPFKKGWEKLTALPGLIKDKVVSKLESYGLLGKSILGGGGFVKNWFGSIFEGKTDKTDKKEVEDDLDSQTTKASGATEDAQDTRQEELTEEQTIKDTGNYQEQVLKDLDTIAKNARGDSIPDIDVEGGDKEGLFGTILGKAKDFLSNGFSFLKDGILQFGKGALKMGGKLLSGLGVGGVAALGAIAAAATVALDVYNDGLATTMERTAGDLQERWEQGDYVGMLMHPVDTLVGAAGLWGEKCAEVWSSIIDGFSDFGKGIGDWFSDVWDSFTSWLPSWLGGKSKEETEKSRALRKQGLSANEIEEFNKENASRSAVNDEAMTVEEFKELKKMEADAKAKRKRNAEKEYERQTSTEYRKKHAAILKKMHDEKRETMTAEEIAELKAVGADDPRYAQEEGATLEKEDIAKLYAKYHPQAVEATSKSVATSAKVEKPELKDTTSASGGKDSGKTVIVNQGSNNGVAIPDVIGNAGTAALAMSNI